MPRRAQHAGDDVEQPLSPANVKRQTRLVPLGAAAHASPLMRQASMAHHAHGGAARTGHQQHDRYSLDG